MLEFDVRNQKITRTDDFEVVADSRNYLSAHFVFSEEWTDSIFAVFGFDGCFFQVELDEEGRCMIPFEVIKAPCFTVSVFCEKDRLVTANAVTVGVEKSGFTEGEVPGTPTPTVWAQYMEQMKNVASETAPVIGENGNWYLWDNVIGAYVDSGVCAEGKQGERGETGPRGPQGNNGRSPYIGVNLMWYVWDENSGSFINTGWRAIGEKGYTPVKGTDYWTEEDKAEIKTYVEDAILGGVW